jgi:cardiolipin synthase A/B
MDHLFDTLHVIIVLLSVVLAVGSAGHALLRKSDPRSSLVWVVICLTLPLAGPVFYWSFGANRIFRRTLKWRQSGRRLGSGEIAPRIGSSAALELPPEARHLETLRNLSDRVAHGLLLAGNRLSLLSNGEEAYPSMLAAIAAARESVHLSTYIFDNDTTGRAFAAALREAEERGVNVRVVLDSLGEKYSYPSAVPLFKGSGVQVGRFLPLLRGIYVNLRNHRKLLIIDGSLAFTGGMNISDRHLVETASRPVVDLHFSVSGPVVADLQKSFLEDWYFTTGEFIDNSLCFPELVPVGCSLVRGIADGPDREYRKLQWIIIGALSCARERVEIMTPYLIPDRSLISALATAALRGVEVTIILPRQNNLPFVHWANRAFLPELLQFGIRIFYHPPPFVHTKLFLVDGVWGLIGSANLDPRSLQLNFELNLEFYDPQFCAVLGAHFQEALLSSQRVFPAELAGRSLPEKLRDSAAKLFSPYL